MIDIALCITYAFACVVSFVMGFRFGREWPSVDSRRSEEDRVWQREDWNQKLERRRRLRARFEGKDGAA